jgi:hypothetical protein
MKRNVIGPPGRAAILRQTRSSFSVETPYQMTREGDDQRDGDAREKDCVFDGGSGIDPSSRP